jgi:hypothetical protein
VRNLRVTSREEIDFARQMRYELLVLVGYFKRDRAVAIITN